MKRYLSLITLTILIIILSACNSASTKPNPGVYLEVNGQLIELKRVRGNPSTANLPTAADLQPVLKFYLPLDDVKQVQLRSLSNKLSFDTVSAKDDVYEIKPSASLTTGAYCLSLGGPLVLPQDVSYWCFQVNSAGAANFGTLAAVTPIVIPPTQPASSNKATGRIAFINGDIYTMNADGTGLTNLTNNPANYALLKWSPDGKKLSFTMDPYGKGEGYVINADGSGLTNLTNNPAGDFIGSWSPDSKRIAFTSNRDGRSQIYIINVDGTGLTNISNSPSEDSMPEWSPDGKRIVFASLLSRLSSEGGHWLQLYVINADGSGLKELTTSKSKTAGGGTSVLQDELPSWSSDGKLIAFVRLGNGDFSEGSGIYVIKPNGDGLTRITKRPVGTSNGQAYSWSPDGKSITFFSFGNLGTSTSSSSGPDVAPLEALAIQETGIYVVNADGSGEIKISQSVTQGIPPSWSSDGKQITFMSFDKTGKSFDVFVMNTDGSGLTQLTHTGSSGFPQWQP
jgi:TolB protein